MTAWALFTTHLDDDTHAVTDNGKVSICEKPVSFPTGSTDAPTCPECLAALPHFPGQLITQANGLTFKHDPGAKGGRVYEGATLRGSFLLIDAGDDDTPCGVYVKGWTAPDEYLYADTYDGAAACLYAYEYGQGEGKGDNTPAATFAERVADRLNEAGVPVSSHMTPEIARIVREELERTP
jgi:hypothetical protein